MEDINNLLFASDEFEPSCFDSSEFYKDKSTNQYGLENEILQKLCIYSK